MSKTTIPKGKEAKATRNESFAIGVFIKVTLVLIVLLVIPLFLLSTATYSFYAPSDSSLKIAFQHTGKRIENCDEKDLIKSEGERYRKSLKETKRVEMNMARLSGCARERFPVIVEVFVDDKVILDRPYKPKGIKKDMASYIYDEFIIKPGVHKISARMYDTGHKDAPDYAFEQTVEVKPSEIKLLRFDDAVNKLVME